MQVWGEWLLLCHLLEAHARHPAWVLGWAALRRTMVPSTFLKPSPFLGPRRVWDLLGQIHLTTKITVTKVARHPVYTSPILNDFVLY